jgi:hypothetical protein
MQPDLYIEEIVVNEETERLFEEMDKNNKNNNLNVFDIFKCKKNGVNNFGLKDDNLLGNKCFRITKSKKDI